MSSELAAVDSASSHDGDETKCLLTPIPVPEIHLPTVEDAVLHAGSNNVQQEENEKAVGSTAGTSPSEAVDRSRLETRPPEFHPPPPEPQQRQHASHGHHGNANGGAGTGRDRTHTSTQSRTAVRARQRHSSVASSLCTAVFALWAVTTLTALTLAVVADVFQGERPQFPLVPAIGTSIGLNVVAALLALLLAKLTKKRFAIFQPFSGGQRFVAMQASGYSIATLSALAMAVLVEVLPANDQASPRYGVYAVLGSFATLAQVLLITSLLFFVPPRSGSKSNCKGRASAAAAAGRDGEDVQVSFWDLTQPPVREYAFITLCCFVMIASAFVAEMYPQFKPFSVVVVGGFGLVAMATVRYVARHFVPSYRMFIPLLDTVGLTLMQVLGNALLLISFCGSIILYNARTASPSSWHLGIALIGVTGICAHELLLRLAQLHAARATATASALDAAATLEPNSLLLRELATNAETRHGSSLYGAFLSSVVSFLLAVAVFLISLGLSSPTHRIARAFVTNRWLNATASDAFSPSSSLGVAAVGGKHGGDGMEYVTRGLLQVQGLLTLLLFLLPILTHLQGRIAFGQGYEVWQPFKGSLDYVLLQATGWAFYGFGILCATLHASEERGQFHFLLLLVTSLLLSQLLVHMSLHVFDESKLNALLNLLGQAPAAVAAPQQDEEEKPESPASTVPEVSSGVFPPPPASAPTHAGFPGPMRSLSPSAVALQNVLQDAADASGDVDSGSWSNGCASSPTRAALDDDAQFVRTLMGTVLNGEMLLSLVLFVVSMLIRGVCDAVVIADYSHNDHSRSRGTTLTTATMRLNIPVRGLVPAARVLALLATPMAQLSMRGRIPFLHVANTSSSFNVLQTIAWLLYLGLLFVSIQNGLTGETHYFMCTREYQVMEYTAHGLLLGCPLLCVVISNFCEAQQAALTAATSARVQKLADALVYLLEVSDKPPAVQRRAAEMIRAVAGPRLAATDWGHVFMNGGQSSSTIADHEVGAEAGTATGGSSGNRHGHAGEDAEVSITAARYLTAIMCLASSAAFTSAAFLAASQPVITLLFGVAGGLVLTLACVSLHYVLGTKLYGHTDRYSLFMPFVGGARFVLWQAVGWMCYTVVVCLLIACAIEGRGSRFMFFVMHVLSISAQCAIFHSIPLFDVNAVMQNGFVRRNAEGLLAAITLLGTFAFARAYDLATEGGLSTSTSALVPVVVVSLAVCLTVPMGLLSLRRQAEHYGVSPFALLDGGNVSDDDEDGAGDDGEGEETSFDSYRTSQCTTPQMSVTSRAALGGGASNWASPETSLTNRQPSSNSVTRSPGTPLPGTGLHRRTSTMSALSEGIDNPLARDATDFVLGRNKSSFVRQRSRASAYTIGVAYALSLLIALFLVLLLPFAVVFLAYSYMHNAKLTYEAGTRTLELIVVCFVVVITVPMVVAPIARRSRAARTVHAAFCTWSIYSIPTMTVLIGLMPALLINTRGALLFSTNVCSVALLSTVPYVHLTAFIFSVICCSYLAHYHFYHCYHLRKESFAPWHCLTDMLCALFWLWYGRRFVGRPEVTGRYQSPAASRFFQKYFFEGLSHWFSLKIICADLYLLPSEKGVIALVNGNHSSNRKEEKESEHGDGLGDALRSQTHRRIVDRRKPENQYLFSFHAHGVFPGTAIYVPKTSQFEKLFGNNSHNFISTHCADVVFAVPLMREFPLCLGALTVSRAGIDHSINDGNSPLIVTGGQTEMLLVQKSTTELHLVCHHLGFVKMAMRHNIPLVPVLSFNECNVLDNVHCVPVQRWFLKRIGFPFPTLPHGYFHLPLPNQTPITVVVGPPLMPLPGRENWEDPACQEEMRIRYFQHLEYLFYRYREAAGYPDMTLSLHYGVDDSGVLATPPPPGIDVAKDYVLNEKDAAIHRVLDANRRNREADAAKRAAQADKKAGTATTAAAATGVDKASNNISSSNEYSGSQANKMTP